MTGITGTPLGDHVKDMPVTKPWRIKSAVALDRTARIRIGVSVVAMAVKADFVRRHCSGRAASGVGIVQ